MVTRKPLNVRMGKCKGAKVRLYTYIKKMTPLAAVSSLRGGLQKRLRRFISIRLGRPIFLLTPLQAFVKVEWAYRHRTQVNFLRERAAEVKALLLYIRRPSLKVFFGRLFRAAWRRPRLRWRFRWPLLPKISSRLRPRRRKWGLGIKYSAPIWAGLGSLLAGVRRVGLTTPRRTLGLVKVKGELAKFFYRNRQLSAKSVRAARCLALLQSRAFLKAT